MRCLLSRNERACFVALRSRFFYCTVTNTRLANRTVCEITTRVCRLQTVLLARRDILVLFFLLLDSTSGTTIIHTHVVYQIPTIISPYTIIHTLSQGCMERWYGIKQSNIRLLTQTSGLSRHKKPRTLCDRYSHDLSGSGLSHRRARKRRRVSHAVLRRYPKDEKTWFRDCSIRALNK